MARQLHLRRPDACATCARPLAVGDLAAWDRASRTVRCPSCAEFRADLDQGLPAESSPGASADREHERRRSTREERIRERGGPLGGLLVALASEPAHERSWAKGAAGERWLAAQLSVRTASSGVVLLHDRRIPGTRANIDHIAVGPSGVFVIDAKNYSGKIQVRRDGGLTSVHRERLMVKGHNQTHLVEMLLGQVDVVQTALETREAAVRGVLCFVKGDWPLFGGADRIRGVEICWPKRAAQFCGAPGPLSPGEVHGLAERLARALPPA